MKKTVTVNLNGRVFTIDEDAYHLLDSYLHNLRIYFRKEEGSDEIIADFEARIEELLSERVRLGYEVISIKEVEEVIARVGKPDDFSDAVQDDNDNTVGIDDNEPKPQGKKKFFRNIDDKMFGGICSGIGAYFGWDVLPVRIIMIILLFATQLIIVPFYLLAWIIFPSAKTAEEKLRMHGKPITVENIGKTVAAEAEKPEPTQNRGCLAGFLDFCVGFIKVCLIGLGLIVAIPILFVLFIMLVVLFAVLVAFGGGLLGMPFAIPMPDFAPLFFQPGNQVLIAIALVVLIGLPIIALVYTIVAYFAKLKPLHRGVKWACLGIWFLALIFFLITGFHFNRHNIFNNWGVNWKVTVDDGSPLVSGNGQLADAEYILTDPVKSIRLTEKVWANLQIEQVPGDSTSIFISGDENLIEKIKYQLHEGKLVLSTHNSIRLNSDNNLIIRIRTSEPEKIQSEMLGNILINKPFQVENLEIKIEGAGRFRADSLNVGALKVKSQGIGSTELAGNIRRGNFVLEGAGEINAYELRADSIIARVDGVGSVTCDPVKYLKADLNGIGKISYKSEPEVKHSGIVGMGKIGKE
ncbi:DUF2807 domain-containing protein [Bacteroidales bacterium OttesenSCG-928-A17]|nr:DUF2807 domain-containing protein [Bacteroidales bacterium OttesenSCG-928-A17]